MIEKVADDDPATAEELADFATKPAGSPDGLPNPEIVTNGSRVGTELIGGGISCGLTVVSAIGVAGGAAAEVPTGAGTRTCATRRRC